MTTVQFPPNIPILLDGRPVEKITAFLFPNGGNEDPKKLNANAGKSFQGSIILGMGFTFDDTNPDATPIAEMHRLIDQNPKNSEVIFPYIGGEEVNSSPTHAHHRYVINFGEMSEKDVRNNYPDLMAIVEEKVKPGRISLPPKNSWNRTVATKWWLFGADRKELKEAIAGSDRVLVTGCSATKYLGFPFLDANMVFSHKLVVFTLDKFSQFATMKSRTHEIWATFFSSTLAETLTYNPSDCFETFPFPPDYETNPTLEEIGKTYYEYRADLMVRNNEGLTDTYNRFHDPHEDHPDILKLRALHQNMDQAVLNAYGWQDIDTTCGFALDYLDGDPEDLPTAAQDRIEAGDLFFTTPEEAIAFDVMVRGNSAKRGKLPWRYKWPEAIHDEVLARLLALNQERYDQEIRLGVHGQASSSKGSNKSKGTKAKAPKQKQVNPTIPGMEA